MSNSLSVAAAKSGYRRTITRAGRAVDVEYTYPTRFGNNLTRAKHRGHTPDAVEKYNEELQVRRLTRLLNENYVPEDWWVTLHYEEHNRPSDYTTACKVLSAFIPKLRVLYNEHQIELKYVKCTAYGSRGGVHHHLVLPQGVKTREITKLWKEHIKATHKARPPEYVALYSTGEYSGIAAYIVRQKQDLGEGEKYIKKWVASRNLKRPVSEAPQQVHKITWQEPPMPWAGYEIDTYSIRAGVNPVTGRPYLFYRMIKLPPNFTCYDSERRRMLKGKEAVQWYRNNNKKYLKEHWLDLAPEGEVVFKKRKGVEQDE